MRPAQKAPENPPLGRARNVASAGFNEAGAKSAGKPRVCRLVINHLKELQ